MRRLFVRWLLYGRHLRSILYNSSSIDSVRSMEPLRLFPVKDTVRILSGVTNFEF